jgi:hypothetical protein
MCVVRLLKSLLAITWNLCAANSKIGIASGLLIGPDFGTLHTLPILPDVKQLQDLQI